MIKAYVSWIGVCATIILCGFIFGGCTIVIGRHPNPFYPTKRICAPCIEATDNFGIGVQVLPKEKKWYRKVVLGWRYE